jgi:hypothetical protein
MTQPQLVPEPVITLVVTPDDLTLLDQFEATTLAADAFGHREHVRVGWTCLQLDDLAEASQRFINGLKNFANFHGATGLYHETITWAFLLVINERMGRMGRPHSWQEFAEENPDLLSGGAFLSHYYRRETLASDLARKVFVLPDFSPGVIGGGANQSAGGAL